jgi:hypothetical protein
VFQVKASKELLEMEEELKLDHLHLSSFYRVLGSLFVA